MSIIAQKTNIFFATACWKRFDRGTVIRLSALGKFPSKNWLFYWQFVSDRFWLSCTINTLRVERKRNDLHALNPCLCLPLLRVKIQNQTTIDIIYSATDSTTTITKAEDNGEVAMFSFACVLIDVSFVVWYIGTHMYSYYMQYTRKCRYALYNTNVVVRCIPLTIKQAFNKPKGVNFAVAVFFILFLLSIHKYK